CRAGADCPFIHDDTRAVGVAKSERASAQPLQPQVDAPTSHVNDSPAGAEESQIKQKNQARQYAAQPVDPSRVVQRPVPLAQAENPRAFQLGQVRRRFAAEEQDLESKTILKFSLTPSDPDFPFEMSALECVLTVPQEYPAAGTPSIRVKNKDMDRGYQINIERGFDQITAEHPRSTLLQMLNLLDKQLEFFLAAPKAETIKLVANLNKQIARSPEPELPADQNRSHGEVSQRATETLPPSFSDAQKASAEQIREAETRQLEARLGRLPRFEKSADGYVYTVPIEARKREELPVSLQSVKTVKLYVPRLYNLEPPGITVVGVEGEEARNVERSFSSRVSQNSQYTLMNHVNYLVQNMYTMAKDTSTAQTEVQSPVAPATITIEPVAASSTKDDRSHIITIPRPPEWTVVDAEDADDSDDSYSYDSGDETEDEDIQEESTSQPATSTAERGILMSFPFLELHGIELLELVSLSITVKCDRCKDTMDVTNLKNNTNADVSGIRSVSCKKCAYPLGIGYRMDTMHVNSVRAGYLDLDGCSIVDLLPSNFVPTCSECSSPYPLPGVVSVRGESSLATCRECHRKMTFTIPEVKFLQVSASAVRASRAPARKKAKEQLGIVAGQELPRRGRCSHYSKSYRWFRFSCCAKVYPCDRCHDAATDHHNEHANRMICGFCSREQNYRPEDCGICRATLVGKRGSGFWEGGKGTRDKLRMSRKGQSRSSSPVHGCCSCDDLVILMSATRSCHHLLFSVELLVSSSKAFFASTLPISTIPPSHHWPFAIYALWPSGT
ncbi:hypothetical protein NA57DRAFT_39832, partial [Rhizodiscina lignyota]